MFENDFEFPDFSFDLPDEEESSFILGKPHLHAHHRSFTNCYALYSKSQINYEKFLKWKENPDWETTGLIATAMLPYITQYYDFITTAPPSRNRDLDNYCTFKLAQYLSGLSKIPFIISFKKRRFKKSHGRFQSLKSEPPQLVKDWYYIHKSILFVDDFITSGNTAKTCYEKLRFYKNHVDGLIFCEW